MKNLTKIAKIPFLIIILTLSSFYACSNEDDLDFAPDNLMNTDQMITASEKTSLLFMLEEEKLARDTYTYINNIWAINEFANIQKSEQAHMTAIQNLLEAYKISYTILPEGEFENQDLQNYYNQFVIDGAASKSNAFQIGATIEDLDIIDLQEYISISENNALIDVFKSLECGSRNHLRSFVQGITNLGDSYTPQFLTQTAYDAILQGSQEQCN
jgi:hypothetical protein